MEAFFAFANEGTIFMKIWILIPVIVVFIFQTTEALAQKKSLLLTPKEFDSLTFAEQKSYIKNLREIFVEMNEMSPLFAAELAKRSTLFAALWDSSIPSVLADAWSGEEESPASAVSRLSGNSKVRHFSILSLAKNSELYATDILHSLDRENKSDQKSQNELEQQLEKKFKQAVLFAKFASHLSSNNEFNKEDPRVLVSDRKEKNIRPAISHIKEAHDQLKVKFPKAPFLEKAAEELRMIENGELGSDRLNWVNDEKMLVPYANRFGDGTTPNSPRKSVPEASGADVSVGTLQSVNASDKSKAPESKFYRCMYAGFVIENGPNCMAPQAPPWPLTSIDQNKFMCVGKTVLCNPLIFGVDVSDCDWQKTKNSGLTAIQACLKKSKPICTPPAWNATSNCAQASNKDSALESAVHLINDSQDNKKHFQDFLEQFTLLCYKDMIDLNAFTNRKDKKRVVNDIKRTCEHARARLDKIKAKYNLQSSNDDAAAKDSSKSSSPTKKGVD